MQTKHKKRGSTLTLILMLIVLLGLVVAIIFWPVEAKASPEPALTEQDDLEETTLVRTGDVAPDFTVKMTDGRKLTLSALRGKVVLVNFWATWCPPCRQELTHVQKEIIDHFKGQEFVFLPISRGEKRETVEKFRKKMGYSFPMGLDPDQSIFNKFASNYIPRNFLIGKDGRIAYISVGFDEAEFQALIAEIKKAL